MKKSLIEIYALAVCFMAVICFAIVFGILIYDIIEITNPEFSMSSRTINKHSSNDKFIDSVYREAMKKKLQSKTDEEITKLRNESFALDIQDIKRKAMQSLVKLSIIIIIDIVLFYLHWILARRARISADRSD